MKIIFCSMFFICSILCYGQRLIIFGDSLSDTATAPRSEDTISLSTPLGIVHVPSPIRRCTHTGKMWPEFLSEQFGLELENQAVSCSTSADALRKVQHLPKNYFQTNDIVVFFSGSNDYFRPDNHFQIMPEILEGKSNDCTDKVTENILKAANLAQEKGAKYCIFIGLPDVSQFPIIQILQKTITEYQTLVPTIIQSHNEKVKVISDEFENGTTLVRSGFVDLYSISHETSAVSIPTQEPTLFDYDTVHPSTLYHRIYSDAIAAVILEKKMTL